MNEKCVYLDYNATTPLEKDVLDEIQKALATAWGNPSSRYTEGINAKEIIEKARHNVASVVGGKSKDVIFTSGGTEANNMMLRTAIKYFHQDLKSRQEPCPVPRPHIITSNLEHDSVRLVLQHMEQENTADVTYVPASKKTGHVMVDDIVAAVRPTTVLVTVMLANNETGVIQPVSEICKRVRGLKRTASQETRKILLHTDAAQAVGKVRVDIEELDVDYLTIVGHKFYGPRIGALYVKDVERGTPLFPMFFGGGQERNFRPGTENTGMIAGLGKASELIVSNLETYQTSMKETRDYLEKRLEEEFEGRITFNGRYAGSPRLPNTCNVSILGPQLHGSRILQHATHLQASVGAACHSTDGPRASPILLALGIPKEVALNALRLSVGRYTSKDDIDLVISDLVRVVKELEA